MRVAIFTDTHLPQVNGVARTVARVSSYLKKRNVPYLIFTPYCGPLPLESENVHTFSALNLPLYPECKIALPYYPRIRDTLDKFKPDLLHLVTEFSMGLCGLKYAAERNLPVVASYTTNFSRYLSYYKLGFLENLSWRYLRWFHNQCHLNYCPSQTVRDELEKEGFQNITVWGRGIDLELFSPNKKSDVLKNIAPGKNLFYLYVGRLAPEKDLDVLFDAWRIVSSRLPEAQLVITGDGPIAEELKRRNSKGVTFTGYRHGEDLAAVYAAGDIFVFPSTTETFGNVVLEAMAAGLPIVAAASGGVKNLLVDGDNGIACSPRNYHEMAVAMLKLAQNGDLRAKMSFRARQFALKLTWDGILGNLLNSYQQVIAWPEVPFKDDPLEA